MSKSKNGTHNDVYKFLKMIMDDEKDDYVTQHRIDAARLILEHFND